MFLGKLWERLFWGLILLAVLGFLTVKVNGFYSKYRKNVYRTEIREVDETNRTWPAIKVCSLIVWKQLWLKTKDFCYNNHSFHTYRGKIPCNKGVNHFNIYSENSTTISEVVHDYAYPTICAFLNISEVHYDTSEGVYIIEAKMEGTPRQNSFEKKDQDHFKLFIEGDYVGKDLKFGVFEVRIQVKTIDRLQFPFRSNCTNGENDLNVFPPPYTREKCAFTHRFYEVLSRCGSVPDHWKKYVKSHHKRGWDFDGGNRTDDNVLKCIHKHYPSFEYLVDKVPTVSLKQCPLPCREIATESAGKTTYMKKSNKSTIVLKIPSIRITEVHEIATYTSDNLLTDLGSWLGLLVGMSLLSLVEIVAFIYTVVKEKWS